MEGLRGIAAITVLLGHVQAHLARGVDLGVGDRVMDVLGHGLTLFFALSGFLLFRPFAAGIVNGTRFPDVRRFFRNRALRIFPAYLVVFALASFVLGIAFTRPINATDGTEGVKGVVGYLTDWTVVLPNLAMLQTFFPYSMKTGLSVAWTLSVELVFYLALPVLGILAWRIARRTRRVVAAALLPAAVVLAIGTVGKIIHLATFHPVSAEQAFYLEWGGDWYAVFARSFLVHADLFAFGMAAAVVVTLFESGVLQHGLLRPVRIGAVVAGLALAAIGVRAPLGQWNSTLFAVVFGLVILIVALPPSGDRHHGALAKALDLPPVRYLGVISYSVYLWHDPLIFGLQRIGWVGDRTASGFIVSCVAVLVVTIAFSSLTYFFVERPPLRLKKRTDAGSAEAPVTRRGRRVPAADSEPVGG